MQNLISDHPRNKTFVERGKLIRFADLNQTSQNAIIHYMSVDGAAWAVEEEWPDWKWGEGQPCDPKGRAKVLSDINKFRSRFIENFGDEIFGYVEVPWNELLEAVNGDEHLMGIPYDFTGPIEEYDVPTWPVILSSCHNETLQDGWNRFSMYCQLKMTIPVIWYPD